MGGALVLGRKRFGTVVLAVGVVFLALILWASPAWAQTATLTVNKTDSPDPAIEGEILNYNIEVTNTGEDPATNVTLTDDLPAGTTFVSASTTAGTCPITPDEGDDSTDDPTSDPEVVCNLGDIAAGASVTVAIEVRAT